MRYKTVIMSDLHLGSTYSRAEDISNFIDGIECDVLILNGDIIDGWALKRGNSWTKEHMKCVRKIMKKAYKTKVYWLRGNHDDFLHEFIPIFLGNIEILENLDLYGINDKKYLVLHGDIFDIFVNEMKWLAKIGSIGYDFTLWLNKWYNKYRLFMGKDYFSLSKKIKNSVKSATNFIGDFEKHMVNHANKLGYDGVICGHIHKAEIKKIDNIDYMNSGDWVESKTALVEDDYGNWSLINF
jgi:UDP-2,3-diacylglucosamine pyrophosphatase LpxH